MQENKPMNYAQDSNESLGRIPQLAEQDFRDLKKEKSKYYKHECHQQSLKLYREKGMIPEGLRLNAVPYVSDATEKFKGKWEVVLRSGSEMLLDLLISHHEEALQSTWKNIEIMEQNIKVKYDKELGERILQLGNEIAKKDKEKLQEKAQSKLVKRTNNPSDRHESQRFNNGLQREESPNERFRSRDKYGGSGRRGRSSRYNAQRTYLNNSSGRKTEI